jgi:hypothetical protein
MAAFQVGFPIRTTTSSILVDAGLPVGDHVFQLQVQDNDDNISAPMRVLVKITPVIISPTFTTLSPTITPGIL